MYWTPNGNIQDHSLHSDYGVPISARHSSSINNSSLKKTGKNLCPQRVWVLGDGVENNQENKQGNFFKI